MPRTGITYTDVCNAIATIQGNQKKPTVDSIREELKTGSRNTIAKHLLDWKSKNGIKNTTDDGVPIELQNLIQSLWGKIQSDADKKIETHQLEADEEISAAKNQLAQIQQQNTQLHAEITTLNDKLNAQIKTADDLTAALHRADNEKVKSDERIAALESQNQNHKAENERLHQLLKNTQDNLTHYQQAIEKQRVEQQMQLEKERAEYVFKLNGLEKNLSKMTEEKSVIETKYRLIIDEHQILKSNLKMVEEEKSLLQLKNNELIIKHDHLNQLNEKLQNELTIVKNLLKENENALSDTKIQLGILNRENSALNKNHESNENKINLMQSKINDLLQERNTLKKATKETTI